MERPANNRLEYDKKSPKGLSDIEMLKG